MNYPHYHEIPYQHPLKVFQHFATHAGAILLDSSRLMDGCGRYSFIAIDPFLILKSKNGMVQLNQDESFAADPFDVLQQQLTQFPLTFHESMPPFQGGVAGYLSYDLCHQLETIPRVTDDMQFPDLILGFYDLVIAFDHVLQKAWVFSSGYPKQESSLREEHAVERMNWLLSVIERMSPALPSIAQAVCQESEIHSNFTQASYENAVNKVIDYILAGDIFEANISQRFKTTLPESLSAFDLYRRLRLINAAPFAAYLCFDDVVIASASPERFLKCVNRHVETRPIKGTRPRGKTDAEDLHYANELLASQKDQSENVMIVDLLRNDLSRVCEDFSVTVPQLCGLESYATVHHLVSVVQGKLNESVGVVDLLRATFPGGSITGAPKIRSMEIIAELEGIARGPYCGSIVYVGFNGDLDSSIAIRTYAIKNNEVTFQAGGAVVADSDPETEYVETLTKAKALRKALTDIPEEYDITD